MREAVLVLLWREDVSGSRKFTWNFDGLACEHVATLSASFADLTTSAAVEVDFSSRPEDCRGKSLVYIFGSWRGRCANAGGGSVISLRILPLPLSLLPPEGEDFGDDEGLILCGGVAYQSTFADGLLLFRRLALGDPMQSWSTSVLRLGSFPEMQPERSLCTSTPEATVLGRDGKDSSQLPWGSLGFVPPTFLDGLDVAVKPARALRSDPAAGRLESDRDREHG